MKNYNIQDSLYYTKEHEWVKVEGSQATVGVSDYAQDLLTDVVFVELPAVGKEVKQFGAACVVESVKSVSDVYSPLSGKITEANKNLEASPELINNDPYLGGWIYKMENINAAETANLMDSAKYKEYIAGLDH